jgi:hypothetical protein
MAGLKEKRKLGPPAKGLGTLTIYPLRFAFA